MSEGSGDILKGGCAGSREPADELTIGLPYYESLVETDAAFTCRDDRSPAGGPAVDGNPEGAELGQP
jgi:hypothetical protein